MTSSHPLFLASSLPISSSSHDTTAAVYNLLHGVDLEATEAQIELYQTEHMQSIRERQSHIAEEERRIEMMIKHEQQAAALLAQELQEKDLLEKQKGQLLKKQTLEVMMGVRLSFSFSLFTPHSLWIRKETQSLRISLDRKPTTNLQSVNFLD
jgi:hypothetical protein